MKEMQETSQPVDYRGMLVIRGEIFYVDRDKDMLIHHQRPEISVPGTELIDEKGYRRGMLNLASLDLLGWNSPDRPVNEEDLCGEFSPEWKHFRIPPQVWHFSRELGEPGTLFTNTRSLVENWGYHVITEGLSDRLNGKLPVLEYDGHGYVVDLDKMELRRTGAEEIAFRFDRAALSEPSVHYYDMATSMPLHALPEAGGTHPAIAAVELHFPPLNRMDIVGYAKMCGLPPCSLIHDFDLPPDGGSIRAVPVQHIPEIAKQQKDRQIKEKPGAEAPAKRKRHRRGLGGG